MDVLDDEDDSDFDRCQGCGRMCNIITDAGCECVADDEDLDEVRGRTARDVQRRDRA